MVAWLDVPLGTQGGGSGALDESRDDTRTLVLFPLRVMHHSYNTCDYP